MALINCCASLNCANCFGAGFYSDGKPPSQPPPETPQEEATPPARND